MLAFGPDNQAWIILLALSLVASCTGTACTMLSQPRIRDFNWTRFFHECLVRHHIVYPNFYFSILITTTFIRKTHVGVLILCFLVLLSFFFLLLGTQRLREQSDDWVQRVQLTDGSFSYLYRAMRPSALMAGISLLAALMIALNPNATK
jgi:hypothetical protein